MENIISYLSQFCGEGLVHVEAQIYILQMYELAIEIYQVKQQHLVWFFFFFLLIYSFSYMWNQTALVVLLVGLCSMVVECSSFLLKGTCILSWKQVAKFITYNQFASQGKVCHCQSLRDIILLAIDSLLYCSVHN